MVSIIFIIVAIFSALTGVFLIYSGLKGANSCSAWSKGKVVDIHRTSSSDGDAYAQWWSSEQTVKSSGRKHRPKRVSPGTGSPVRWEILSKSGTTRIVPSPLSSPDTTST